MPVEDWRQHIDLATNPPTVRGMRDVTVGWVADMVAAEQAATRGREGVAGVAQRLGITEEQVRACVAARDAGLV